MEFDRPQPDCYVPCVIAQQYSSAVSLRLHSHKDKLFRVVKCYWFLFFFFVLFENCVSVKLPNLKLRKYDTVVGVLRVSSDLFGGVSVVLHHLVAQLGHEVSIRERLGGWSRKILC